MKIVNGNILEAKEKFICHQTNSVSNRAAGLAASIFEVFKFADIYSRRPYPYIAKGDDLPGHIIIRGNGTTQRYVVALGGQYYPGKSHEGSLIDSAVVREGYFWQCLLAISKIENLHSVAFPWQVGCGMAGGNWEHYFKMIENFEKIANGLQKVDVVLYRLM